MNYNNFFIRQGKYSSLKWCINYFLSNTTHIGISRRIKKLTLSRRTKPKQHYFALVMFVLFWFCLYHRYLKFDGLRRKIMSWGLRKHLFQVCHSIDNKPIVKLKSLGRSVQWRLQCCAHQVSFYHKCFCFPVNITDCYFEVREHSIAFDTIQLCFARLPSGLDISLPAKMLL